MTQTESIWKIRATAGGWIFRALTVGGAALMWYSWNEPWWSARFSAMSGRNHMVLHPWGVDVTSRVRQFSDASLYDMPAFFEPFVWTYLGVCMLFLLISLFINKLIKIGPIRVQLATLLVAFVGLSYVGTAVIAYVVGTLKAVAAGTNFIGVTVMENPNYTEEIRMTSQLEMGYYLALAAGVAFLVLALLRRFFVGRSAA